MLDQPKAVLVVGRDRHPVSGLAHHRTMIFGRHLPQPVIVWPDGPVDTNAMLEHYVTTGAHLATGHVQVGTRCALGAVGPVPSPTSQSRP
jgi:hypothetical protein